MEKKVDLSMGTPPNWTRFIRQCGLMVYDDSPEANPLHAAQVEVMAKQFSRNKNVLVIPQSVFESLKLFTNQELDKPAVAADA